MINDAARGKRLSVIGVSLALLRNYNPYEAFPRISAQADLDPEVRQVFRHEQ